MPTELREEETARDKERLAHIENWLPNLSNKTLELALTYIDVDRLRNSNESST